MLDYFVQSHSYILFKGVCFRWDAEGIAADREKCQGWDKYLWGWRCFTWHWTWHLSGSILRFVGFDIDQCQIADICPLGICSVHWVDKWVHSREVMPIWLSTLFLTQVIIFPLCLLLSICSLPGTFAFALCFTCITWTLLEHQAIIFFPK
jgi:hypothetical protein